MTLNQERLAELVEIVGKKLEQAAVEAGDFDPRNGGSWRARNEAAIGRLIEFFVERYEARFTMSHDAVAVRMAGIRSNSTMGVAPALRNWRRAAEIKLDVPAGAGQDDPINLAGSGPVPIEPREG